MGIAGWMLLGPWSRSLLDAYANDRSLDRARIDFFQTGDAGLHFREARLTQIPDALGCRLRGDVDGVASLQNDALDLVRHRHDLVQAGTALVAVGARAAAY